jgi:hypothetical protein
MAGRSAEYGRDGFLFDANADGQDDLVVPTFAQDLGAEV